METAPLFFKTGSKSSIWFRISIKTRTTLNDMYLLVVSKKTHDFMLICILLR